MPAGVVDAAAAAALGSAVDAGWTEQVSWLQRLVRFDSLRGRERPCQEWLASEFGRRGWDVDVYTLADVALVDTPLAAPMIDVDPAGSLQVVATVPHSRPRPQGKSLILQGHVDVVPAGPADMWRDPPFSGDVRDGWLHGRGAQDMKAGIASMVFAVDAIRAAGFRPAAPIHVQTVTEEESTGNGAWSTLARGYRADACLIPEPTANTITRAQSGAVWFRLSVRGKPVHVARSDAGSNAISAAYRLLQELQRLADRMNGEAAADPWFASVPSPVKFNAGRIRGGDWASSTPAWCEVDCRLGILPGRSVEKLQREIERVVADACAADPYLSARPAEVVWNGFLAEGAVLEPGSAAEAILGAAHEAVLGVPMEARISTAVNDTRYYAHGGGMTALCYGPSGKGMHGFDERADLGNLKTTTRILALFIANWCGLERR
ncbi:MAG: ArgE/DapE family deacylase [Rhizobiaceae bacterium]